MSTPPKDHECDILKNRACTQISIEYCLVVSLGHLINFTFFFRKLKLDKLDILVREFDNRFSIHFRIFLTAK